MAIAQVSSITTVLPRTIALPMLFFFFFPAGCLQLFLIAGKLRGEEHLKTVKAILYHLTFILSNNLSQATSKVDFLPTTLLIQEPKPLFFNTNGQTNACSILMFCLNSDSSFPHFYILLYHYSSLLILPVSISYSSHLALPVFLLGFNLGHFT